MDNRNNLLECQTKKCNDCGELKGLFEFHKNKCRKDGLCIVCKKCNIKKVKTYRENNIEKCKKYDKKHRKENKKERKILNGKWRENNKEKICKRRKEYHQENRKAINARNKKWRTENPKNPQKAKEARKRYRMANLEKMRQKQRKYNRKRRLKLTYVLSDRISGNMRHYLKNSKNGKHWEYIVNYTLDDLKQHLEDQFTNNMTWKEFLTGKIHIDHIIPVSLWVFNSYNDREFKQCWALCNLQPLWSVDNIRKGNKICLN